MRGDRVWVRACRAGFAALALLAIGYQLWVRSALPGFRADNFFSFFTIQSNLFAAGVLLWGALRPGGASSGRALVRGAAVLYMAITGIVFALLLSDLQDQLQLTIPWVDTVLHRLMPLVMVADWLVDPPGVAVPTPLALLWLAYPLLFVAYSLVRGPLVGWYPYPFLDPARPGGYGAIFVTALAIGAGSAALAWIVARSALR